MRLLTRRASRAVAGMGGGVDAGLGSSGTRRRATMPADVLETQARGQGGTLGDPLLAPASLFGR